MNIDIRDNNRKSDRDQYLEFTKKLDAKFVPISLAKFQELKYNDVERYEHILDKVFVQQKINSGEWGKIINPDKQLPHMELTCKDGKSYIYDSVDVQKLFDDYYGTGRLEHDRYGRPTNKEIVQLGYSIGVNASDNSEATAIKIHHSKNRTHIVLKRGEQ